MEMTELKRENMEELAQTLKEILQGRQFIYAKRKRRAWQEPWGEAIIHPNCVLHKDADTSISYWFRPDILEGIYAGAKSSVRLLLRSPDREHPLPISFHPCVRFGGGNYPKHGQTTKFCANPNKVEFDAWNSTSFHTFEIA